MNPKLLSAAALALLALGAAPAAAQECAGETQEAAVNEDGRKAHRGVVGRRTGDRTKKVRRSNDGEVTDDQRRKKKKKKRKKRGKRGKKKTGRRQGGTPPGGTPPGDS